MNELATSSCYVDAPHGPHEWFPTITDPDQPRVLHIGALSAYCPGAGSLAASRPTPTTDLTKETR